MPLLHRILQIVAVGLSLALQLCAQRLPHSAIPEHYQLRLAPNFSTDSFDGEETIDITVLEPTPAITLNSVELELKEVTIRSGESVQRATVEAVPKGEMVALRVPKALAKGNAQIHIRFSGALNKDLRGFYLSTLGDKKYAVTQLEATDARRAFPCFDEPAMKATFDIALVAPSNNVAISNSKVISDIPGPGPDQHTVTFATTPKISSYLVAMLVGDFACMADEAEGIPIRVCGPPPVSQRMGELAMSAAKFSLRYYNEYFAIKYPYGKLDLIAIPDFSIGAMENPGAITFRTRVLLIDPNAASERQKKFTATAVAHEIAHMWFGDLVTLQWWDDAWLNEGFATWMHSKAVDVWHPQWDMNMQAAAEAMNVMDNDSVTSARPIHAPAANTPAEIEQLFDGFSYDKAAAVLRMVESYVGDESFRDGVRAYLKRHVYGNATAADFWDVQTEVTKKAVNNVMETFIRQAGVPLVSVASRCAGDNTEVELQQTRYFANPSLMDKPSLEIWRVPVCFSVGKGIVDQVCELLEEKQKKLTVNGCQPWVFINSDARGYYRSGYGVDAFAALRKNIGSLSPPERLSILSDEWSMVRIGRSQVGDYLRLAEALRDDRTLHVWGSLRITLEEIETHLLRPESEDAYRAWVRNLVSPAASELGWRPKPGESDRDRALRPIIYYILGVIGQDARTLAEAELMSRKYLQGAPDAIDPSMLDRALLIAAYHGDKDLYDLYIKRMRNPGTPQEYSTLLTSLMFFRQPELMKRTWEFLLSPEVRSQDTYLQLAYSRASEETWNFVATNWPAIQKKIPSAKQPEVRTQLASRLCTKTGREEAEKFFHEAPLEVAAQTEQRALEAIDVCIAQRAQQADGLSKFLGKHQEPVGGAK